MDFNGQFLIVGREGVGGDKSDWCIVAGAKGIDTMTNAYKKKGLTHIYVTKIIDSGEADNFINYSMTNEFVGCSIDQLLDMYNDYLELYNAFQDDEYFQKMEVIKLTISLKNIKSSMNK